jgi:hypothetical protein
MEVANGYGALNGMWTEKGDGSAGGAGARGRLTVPEKTGRVLWGSRFESNNCEKLRASLGPTDRLRLTVAVAGPYVRVPTTLALARRNAIERNMAAGWLMSDVL